jgi:hypothetical protein
MFTESQEGLRLGKSVVIIDGNATVRGTLGHAFLSDGFTFW